MQNAIQKFRQIYIVFEKPAILFENLKILRSSNYPAVIYFLLKFHTRFLLTKKRWVGFFFYFIQILSYLPKLKKAGFYTLVFCTFINNSRSKQNKKSPTHAFVGITKQKTFAKFQQKILKSMVAGARQSFQFFQTKKPGFFEIIEICLNLSIRFCIT